MDLAKGKAQVPDAVAWLGRRLLAPALCAAVAVDVLICVLLIVPLEGWPPIEGVPSFAVTLFALTILPVVGGLVLFGLPAGLLVARLEHGFGASLFELAALGAVAGVLVSAFTPLGLGAVVDPQIGPIFAFAGFVTAAIWTWLNRDLFRSNNGA